VPDRHANTKKISLREALEGIYFDFEGRKDEDPVLVGLLYRPEPQDPSNWAIKQLVLDPGLLDVSRLWQPKRSDSAPRGASAPVPIRVVQRFRDGWRLADT
jgi:hypothetical protein